MAATLRRLQRGEEKEFIKSVRVPFLDPNTGSEDDDAADQPRADRLETERMWVLEDRGRFVGNGGVRTMDLTVPSALGRRCPIIPMGGVTAVGIHPTHRRQGLLTRMMSDMLADCRERNEPVAGLIASESIIYGRYGFGLATETADYRIDSSRSEFKANCAPPQVEIRLIDHTEAAKVLPGLFDAARPARPGEPNRTAAFWEDILADRRDERHGASGSFFAVCDDGYAAYRAKQDADILRAERVDVVVEDIVGRDPGIQAALWRFVLDLDLIGGVTFHRRPLDEPVRWRLADPRQLQVKTIYDRLYLRVLDTVAALTARGYRHGGRLTIDVLPVSGSAAAGADPATGTWILDAGPDGAECRRGSEGTEADLRLDVTTLGSLYLGGFSASTLAGAGLVEEVTSGSLAVADRLFAAGTGPSTMTGF